LIKVSIIIPVYNTEKYIRKCLESAINQTLKDIEIICINDGSTDNSLSILYEYAAKDSVLLDTSLGVRPVITINGNAGYSSGDGSIQNPYVISLKV
jgi:glycosyltransferase involved in cell wall biosynthesis